LHNCRTLLQRSEREHSRPELVSAIETLGGLVERATRTTRISSLLGVEGQGSAVYFGGFKHVLLYDLGFRGRVRRPPTDDVNVLLSFGYTLLTHGVQSAVETVGLDPYVGILHVPGYSRPALVLDLMGEFRAAIVDSVVFQLINARIITQADFEEQPDNADRPIMLLDAGRRRFLATYEERVQITLTDRRSVEQVTMRRLRELQARQMAKVALGDQSTYEPWRIR
jgi:CRISP-associated protein Cas1